VSHSTLQRLVHRQEFEEPTALQGVSEVSIDGGKVRLFSNQGCGKLLAGLQSRSLTGYLLWYIFPIQLVFERGLIVNVFFVPLFVWGWS